MPACDVARTVAGSSGFSPTAVARRATGVATVTGVVSGSVTTGSPPPTSTSTPSSVNVPLRTVTVTVCVVDPSSPRCQYDVWRSPVDPTSTVRTGSSSTATSSVAAPVAPKRLNPVPSTSKTAERPVDSTCCVRLRCAYPACVNEKPSG